MSGTHDSDKQDKSKNADSAENAGLDNLHYEEPPTMTLKDNLGVAIALVALAVIGFLGYIWLTPGKSIATMFSKPEGPAVEVASQAVDPESTAVEHQKCATCGMFADKSASHVVATWDTGSTTHHDSWDCAFGYAAQNGMAMAGVEISHYGSPVDSPHFLDATGAWFLYDTDSPVEGSMPPFVAAFASRDEAMSKHGEMGGEILDYAGLAGKWDVINTPAPADHSTMEMDGHDMDSMDSPQEMAANADNAGAMTEPDSSPQAQSHDHEMNCPYCGMFADKSESHVVAAWADGSHTHHDGWDCAFFYGSENGLNLASAEVALLGSPADSPDWIDADAAWYLYDMDNAVPGSMPPFVAAFTTKGAAQAHQSEWGGELVDFQGLQAKW